MISDIDKIRKVIELFSKKKFSELEKTIEAFGNIDKATNKILNLYALSKLLNINSKKEDYLLAAKYLDKIYSSDISQKIHLNNLIIASINSNNFELVEKHLKNEYLRNPHDPRILEGLSKMEYSKSNMKVSSKYFGEYVIMKQIKAWSSYLSIASLNGL